MIIYPVCIMAIEDDDDREFMQKLYVDYHRLMYSQITKIAKDPWVADDVLQTTLVRLIDKLDRLRSMDRDRLVNYIIVACRNTAINVVKKKIAEFPIDESIDAPLSDDPMELYLEKIEAEEDLQRLYRVWSKLDERTRYLLEARYVLNCSFDEIATTLEIKPTSVRMALTRARRIAKKMMLQDISNEEL